jgi:hypothetical protein
MIKSSIKCSLKFELQKNWVKPLNMWMKPWNMEVSLVRQSNVDRTVICKWFLVCWHGQRVDSMRSLLFDVQWLPHELHGLRKHFAAWLKQTLSNWDFWCWSLPSSQ